MSNEFFDISSIETDTKLEVEGVWRDYNSKAKVKIARWANDDFSRLMRNKYKSVRSVMEGDDDAAAELSVELVIEVMAHTILKDVQGIGYKNQLITNYTPAIGIELLKVKDFREKIKAMSEDQASYLLNKEDEIVKS